MNGNQTLAAPTRLRSWISLSLVALLVASLFSAAVGVQKASAQAEQSDLASVVPADTVLYLSMNMDQNSDQWGLTYDLLERSGINALLQDQTGATSEDLGDAAEQSNFTGSAAIVFTDADALATLSSADLTGTVDTAMTGSSTAATDVAEEVPEGFAFILQPEDPEALASDFETMATDEASSANAELQTVDYNGVTITYWESEDSANPGTATAIVDGTVILATRASDIEPIIDTAQGNNDSLADSEGFNAVTSKLEADTLMFGYMNLDVMLTAMENDPEFVEAMEELGSTEDLSAVKGHVGFAMYASDAGFHADTVVVPNDPAMLENAKTFEPSMASNMPADVMIYADSTDLYSTGIADYFGIFFQEAMSQPAATDIPATPVATPTMDETWAMFEQQLGFNPDTDLLALLDGDYATYIGVQDLDSMMFTPEFLFVSETSDAAKLEETNTTIINLVESMNEGQYELSSSDVEGGTITTATFDPSTTDGALSTIDWGVVDGQLIIGINGSVDKYLDADTPKLADDATYQETMGLLPTENIVSTSYVNIEGQVMPLLDWFASMLMTSTSTLDNHEDCGTYATQLEAQEAYDADPGNLWLLDMDYDGEACEDFFGEAAPSASPASITTGINIPAAGSVTSVDGDAIVTKSILVIGD